MTDRTDQPGRSDASGEVEALAEVLVLAFAMDTDYRESLPEQSHVVLAVERLLAAERDRAVREERQRLTDVVARAGANIGAYRAAQTAIADLDRDHIDVLEVGTILSALRRDVVDGYAASLRAALPDEPEV